MKKVIVLVFLVVAATSVIAQWQPVNLPSYNPPSNCGYYSRVCGVATNDVYYYVLNLVCTEGGMGQSYGYRVYKTTYEGLIWPFLFSQDGTIVYVETMEFISADTGYFIQYDVDIEDRIYRTANGFNSRELCIYTGTHDYLAVEMLSYNNIIALDKEAYIYHLESGEELMAICHLPLEFEEDVNSFPITATENQTLFLACKAYDGNDVLNDIILRSLDGGYSWDTSYISSSVHINELAFSSDNIGMAVANGGIIIQTQDGGNTWESLDSGEENDLFSIDYMNNDTWIAGGDMGTIVFTSDGGESWETLPSTTIYEYDVVKVNFPEKDSTIIVQNLWFLHKSTIDLLTSISEQKGQRQFSLAPNPVKDRLIISSSSITENTELSIFNVSGERVLERQLTDTETQLDISPLPRGVYFVRVQNEKMVEVEKFIKE